MHGIPTKHVNLSVSGKGVSPRQFFHGDNAVSNHGLKIGLLLLSESKHGVRMSCQYRHILCDINMFYY